MTVQQRAVLCEQHRIRVDARTALNAVVYRAVPCEVAVSSILVITPYLAERYAEDGEYFCRAGFNFIVVDARGRGASQGTFVPFEQDGEDGRCVVEWITRQAWATERVGLYGGSYSGFNQWAICAQPAPSVRSLAPVAAVYPGVDFPAVDGLMYLYAARWLAYMDNQGGGVAQYQDNCYWAQRLAGACSAHRSAFLQSAAGQRATLQQWLEQLDQPAYWAAFTPTPQRYAAFDAPALFITGFYDDDQRGTLAYYTQLRQSGQAPAFLLIGPWDHDGTRVPRAAFGGLSHGAQSCLDLRELHRQWYAWTLDDGPRPQRLSAPVMYYVAGLEVWRQAESLDAIEHSWLTLYLSADAAAGLCPGNALAPACTLLSAPAVPTPLPIGNVMSHEPVYCGDERAFSAAHGQVFDSCALSEPLTLCGFAQVTLQVLAPVTPVDICVTLYAVLPDRTAVYLGACNRRVQRTSARAAGLVALMFDSFNFIARALPAGSHLKLLVGLSSPTLWLTANTPDSVVQVLHGGGFASYLRLPVQQA
nr:CocE/NonD family hydrolase [Pseudomonas brassicae]